MIRVLVCVYVFLQRYNTIKRHKKTPTAKQCICCSEWRGKMFIQTTLHSGDNATGIQQKDISKVQDSAPYNS